MMTDDQWKEINSGKAALAEIRLYYARGPAISFIASAFSRHGIPKSLIERADEYIKTVGGCAGPDRETQADKSGREL